MKKTRVVLFILFYLFPILIYGQSNYIVKDSIITSGIKIIKGLALENSNFCQVQINDTITRYSPLELKEYGLNDGRVYVSRGIQIADSFKTVFLERLVKGKMTVYHYYGKRLKTFYLEKDHSPLIEMPKRNNGNNNITFHDQLSAITSDCKNISDAIKLVPYNKRGITKLVKTYNNCELRQFPYFKYGVKIGYGITTMKPSLNKDPQYLNHFNYRFDPGFTIGIFIDEPILLSDFSLHTELSFSRTGYSYNWADKNKEQDLVINTASINIPFLLRYAFPAAKAGPFLNLGCIFSKDFRNDNVLYESTITSNTIFIKKVFEETVIPKNQIGYSVGAGYQYKLNYKNNISIELRWDKLYGMSDYGSIQEAFHVISGINF